MVDVGTLLLLVVVVAMVGTCWVDSMRPGAIDDDDDDDMLQRK